jgi:hypothetical protein
VRDENEGLASLFVESCQQGQDLGRALRVEVAGGFVGQDELGPLDQRSRDRHSLLLPTRKLGRPVGRSISEPHRRQGVGRCLASVSAASSRVVAGQVHVSKAFWLPFMALVVFGLLSAGLLFHVAAVAGAPAQTPWQQLGPAITAYP